MRDSQLDDPIDLSGAVPHGRNVQVTDPIHCLVALIRRSPLNDEMGGFHGEKGLPNLVGILQTEAGGGCCVDIMIGKNHVLSAHSRLFLQKTDLLGRKTVLRLPRGFFFAVEKLGGIVSVQHDEKPVSCMDGILQPIELSQSHQILGGGLNKILGSRNVVAGDRVKADHLHGAFKIFQYLGAIHSLLLHKIAHAKAKVDLGFRKSGHHFFQLLRRCQAVFFYIQISLAVINIGKNTDLHDVLLCEFFPEFRRSALIMLFKDLVEIGGGRKSDGIGDLRNVQLVSAE